MRLRNETQVNSLLLDATACWNDLFYFRPNTIGGCFWAEIFVLDLDLRGEWVWFKQGDLAVNAALGDASSFFHNEFQISCCLRK